MGALSTVSDIINRAPEDTACNEEKLISRLDSRTLRLVLGLLVFSNNIKNGISDIRDSKRRIAYH